MRRPSLSRLHRAGPALAFLLAFLPGSADAQVEASRDPWNEPFFYAGVSGVRLSGALAPDWSLGPLRTVGAQGPAGPLWFFLEVDEGRFLEVQGSKTADLLNGTAGLLLGGRVGGLRLEGGPLVGVQRLEGAHLIPGGSETELVLGGRAVVRSPTWRGVHAAVVVDVQRAFYREPLDVSRVSLRLGWASPFPEAVRSALVGDDAGRGAPPPPTFEVLRREDLADAGIVGWEELTAVLPGWSSWAPNGSATRLAPPGGGHPGAGRWRIVVDGIELPVRGVTGAALDRLPVPLHMVDSIRVHDGPGLLDGRPTDPGVLELFVHDPAGPMGGHVREAGNPRGDPGLAAGEMAENVDRLGRSEASWAGWGGPHGGVAVSAGYHDRYVREREGLLQLRRDHLLIDPSVVVHRLAGSAWARSGPAVHRVRWGRVEGRDYPHLDPLGREVMSDHQRDWVGLSGQVGLGMERAVEYGLAWGRRTLGTLPGDTTAALLDFREEELEGRVTVSLGAWTVSGVGARRRATGGPDLGDPTQTEGRLRVSTTVAGVGVSGAAGRADGRTVGDLLLQRAVVLRGDTELRLTAHLERASDTGLGSLWSWERRGLGLVERYGLTGNPEEAGALWRSQGEARLARLGTPDGVRWTAGLRVGRDGGLGRTDRGGRATDVPVVRVVSGAWAAGWGEVRLGDGDLRGATRLDLELGSRGVEAWRDLRARIPDARLRSTASWRPAPGLVLHGTARGWTGTRWDARWSEDGAPVKLPASFTVDVAARKTVWEGRGWLAVRVADLLDREAASHPLGIPPAMRLNLEAGVRFGG